jgi:phage terminase large subunit-like protein
VKRGPKGDFKGRPLDLAGLPKSGAERVIGFVEKFVFTPKGVGAKKRMVLRPWQRELIRSVFDDPRPRQALWSLPRANGKSTLAAAIGLYGLFADREEGASVLVVASDERQASLIFHIARRMVELNPKLSDACQIYQDRIHVPATDSTFRPLPAESSALHGYDPSLLLVDELHVVTERVWEACTLAAGKRERSLTLAISTPPEDQSSVMYKLAEYGRQESDPAFVYREFSAPVGCRVDDELAWRVANPALYDFLAVDAMRAVQRTTRESTFRRQRLGQWIFGSEEWITQAQWDACADTGLQLPEGAEVCLGLDGSFNGDSTALVAVTTEEPRFLEVVELWERPERDPYWQLAITDLDEAVLATCKRFKVRELVMDYNRWPSSAQSFQAAGVLVVAFPPQSGSLMIQATTRFGEAISNKLLTHSGDLRLTRHVANCVLRETPSGPRLAREHGSSGLRPISLAVAAVMAHDRACWVPPEPVEQSFFMAWR